MARPRVREIREQAPQENGSAAASSYRPRLKDRYEQELRPALKDELGLATVMDVPRLQKITLNMGVGEAKTDAKALDSAIEELTTIAGQRPQIRKARKSIAQIKNRTSMHIATSFTPHLILIYL